MPLATRSVSPVELSRRRLPDSVQSDELQCVTNGTLANLIRQLSSLSRHAEQIFSDIHREVLKIDHRTNTLFLRVDRLAQKVAQSQSSNSLKGIADRQVSIDEAAMRKAFKSCNIIDQHSLDRQTLPQSLQELYQACDAPPQLNQLNPYREDEKEALRYYTDPGYFFELWRQEMLKECGGGGVGDKRRTGRSPTSPSRQRRRQQQPSQQQLQHLPQHQQNALLAYHVSSRSSDYSRFTPSSSNSNKSSANHHHQQQQHKGRFAGAAAPSGTDVLHFPAEYQAPQSLLMMPGASALRQPPPGMSMVNNSTSAENWAQQQQFAEQQQQQQIHAQNMVGQQQMMIDGGMGQQQQLVQHVQALNLSGPGSSSMAATMGMATTTAAATTTMLPFLDDDDDELPPPPPQAQLAANFSSGGSASSSTSSPAGSIQHLTAGGTATTNNNGGGVGGHRMEFLPSGGAATITPSQTSDRQQADVQQQHQQVQFRQKVPPAPPLPPPQSSIPPPPPPPPPNFSAIKIGGDANKTFGGQDVDGNGEDQRKILQRKSSTTSSGGPDNRSQLLIQIQEGVKLKRVQQQEELAEKRAIDQSNDVAAILRKRMEHCLGDSSDSSTNGSPNPEDNEWDD